MKKTTKILAGVVASGAVAALAFVSRGPARDAASTAAAPSKPAAIATTSSKAGAPVAAKERTLRRGAQFVYDVAATRSVGPVGATPAVATTLAGTLSFTVVGATDEGAQVRIELGGVKRTETPKPPQARATDADFATPFFVVMKADGSLASLHFPRQMPGEARRTLRSVVSSMQIVDKVGAATWETVETDEAGQFVAGYQRDGLRVSKSKVRYDLVRGASGLVPVATIGKYEPTGAVKLTLDASGWPAAVEEDATVTASFQGGQLALKATTRARLVSSGESRSHFGSFEVAAATFDPDVDALGEDMAIARKNADEGLVKGATFAELTTDYGAAKEAKDRNRAVARMGALLRVLPEAVADARAQMLAKTTPERTAKAIASALGSAATPEAQKALAAALASPDVPAPVKVDAAISLGLAEKPTAEGRAALREAAKDPALGDSATLALGNAANAMKKAGEDPGDIVTDLLAKLAAAQTAGEKVLLLDALGNAGDARAVEAIKTHVAAPESAVRAAAVSALRFQKDASIDGILTAVVTDPDVMVRKAVLFAMAQRDLVPLLAAYERVLKSEPEAELRKSAIRVLARSVDTVPEVQTLLLWASQHDADESVKQAATDALSRPKTGKTQ